MKSQDGMTNRHPRDEGELNRVIPVVPPRSDRSEAEAEAGGGRRCCQTVVS